MEWSGGEEHWVLFWGVGEHGVERGGGGAVFRGKGESWEHGSERTGGAWGF